MDNVDLRVALGPVAVVVVVVCELVEAHKRELAHERRQRVPQHAHGPGPVVDDDDGARPRPCFEKQRVDALRLDLRVVRVHAAHAYPVAVAGHNLAHGACEPARRRPQPLGRGRRPVRRHLGDTRGQQPGRYRGVSVLFFIVAVLAILLVVVLLLTILWLVARAAACGRCSRLRRLVVGLVRADDGVALFDFLLKHVELVEDARAVLGEVVAEAVAFVHDAPHHIFVALDLVGDDEERGFDVVTPQQIKDLRRRGRRRVVDRKRAHICGRRRAPEHRRVRVAHHQVHDPRRLHVDKDEQTHEQQQQQHRCRDVERGARGRGSEQAVVAICVARHGADRVN